MVTFSDDMSANSSLYVERFRYLKNYLYPLCLGLFTYNLYVIQKMPETSIHLATAKQTVKYRALLYERESPVIAERFHSKN